MHISLGFPSEYEVSTHGQQRFTHQICSPSASFFSKRTGSPNFSNSMCFVIVDEVDLAEFDNFDDNHFGHNNSEGQVNGATSDSSSDSLTEKTMEKAPPPQTQGRPTKRKKGQKTIGRNQK